ncbi:MAG: substrate-binding domain-containing protein [Chthoniobacter sp.]|nr:substrate-binding domain-containing protein [Chthoniobacter sp.]
MPRPQPHLIFLDELRRHSDREVCLGAAEHAATHPTWHFDPWPVGLGERMPSMGDLSLVSGIFTTERAIAALGKLRQKLTAPIVYCLADELHPEADAVGLNENLVGKMAAEHLLNRGYRHFCFIGSETHSWSRQRCEGFVAALAEAGEFQPDLHAFPAKILPVYWSWNLAHRNRHLQDLLAILPRPCGIFAANDVIACFVSQAVRHLNLSVPDDFGLVGVDNDPFPNAAAGFAISSVELPFREVGRQAARLLAGRMRGEPAGRHVRLPPVKVVVRASTHAFMTESPLVRQAQAFIESRCAYRVTVADVVHAVRSNRVTLGRYFQRELDVTISDYIRRRRLAHASDRLRSGGETVDAVAEDCGYSSTSYFSRVLKKITGHRPGQLRSPA